MRSGIDERLQEPAMSTSEVVAFAHAATTKVCLAKYRRRRCQFEKSFPRRFGTRRFRTNKVESRWPDRTAPKKTGTVTMQIDDSRSVLCRTAAKQAQMSTQIARHQREKRKKEDANSKICHACIQSNIILPISILCEPLFSFVPTFSPVASRHCSDALTCFRSVDFSDSSLDPRSASRFA